MKRAKGRIARRLKARAKRAADDPHVRAVRNAENCYRKADESEAHGAHERAASLRERAKDFEMAAREAVLA
jgi:hypothetical protein